MLIRQESPTDYAQVYELVKMSFATSSHSDGTEADYLNQVRKKDSFIPKLSLVAELAKPTVRNDDSNDVRNNIKSDAKNSVTTDSKNDKGKIVGQVVLYKTPITTKNKEYMELVLSPICVHPQYFGQAIARTMMQKAFIIAKDLGYSAVFLCGEPDFYTKLGFRPSYEFDIFHIKDRSAQWSMVLELNKGFLTNITGTINTD